MTNINNDPVIVFDPINEEYRVVDCLLAYLEELDVRCADYKVTRIERRATAVDVYYPELTRVGPEHIYVDPSNQQSGFTARFQELIDGAYAKAKYFMSIRSK